MNNPVHEHDIDVENAPEGFNIERMDSGGQDDDIEIVEDETGQDDEPSDSGHISDDDDDEASESDSEGEDFDFDEDKDFDEDEFAVSFRTKDDWGDSKRYPEFQNIPDDKTLMMIGGCKTRDNPLYQSIPDFLQTDNKIWDKSSLMDVTGMIPLCFQQCSYNA
jgi:hypothetical protein